VKSRLRIIAVVCAFLFAPMAIAQQPPLLKKCQACHGKQLTGKKKSPSIVDFSYEELYASLTTDVPKKMKRIASKLTDKQKSEISAYIFNSEDSSERQPTHIF